MNLSKFIWVLESMRRDKIFIIKNTDDESQTSETIFTNKLCYIHTVSWRKKSRPWEFHGPQVRQI